MKHLTIFLLAFSLLFMPFQANSIPAFLEYPNSQGSVKTTQTTRTGGWVDTIIFTEIGSQEEAVTALQDDRIDIYGFGMDDPDLYAEVRKDPRLAYDLYYGSYTEITINPTAFTDGRLNPFKNSKIREALNFLIDRDYIVQNILGGLGSPKLLPITSKFPDYQRYLDKVKKLEREYAYNQAYAASIISTEMKAMGATLVNGFWHHNGQLITLNFLIRTEDARYQIGKYVSDQLESVGFKVERQYKTIDEAASIWVQSNPADGLWNLYTGGWITQIVSRDQGSNFTFFYTPYGYPISLHQAYQPGAEFEDVALKLRNNAFSTMAERDELFERALELCLSDTGTGSVRIWLVDETAFTLRQADVLVANDLAGGIIGGYIWPYTLRFADKEGGTMRIATGDVLLSDPWNPVAGSNWVYDGFPQRGTVDNAILYDPRTGLIVPQRIERAEVTVKSGLPVQKSSDWVDLSFAPEIIVPDDAWVDWDATEQRWITAGEKFTEPQTALTKSTVYYPEDLFETVTWHDGSPISVGDFMLGMILLFDQGKPESAIYDEAAKYSLDLMLGHLKGFKIVSTNPLVIETYDDTFYMDAEMILTTWFPSDLGTYPYGTGMWTNVGLGILAEEAGELAFSSDKADQLSVGWTNFISGPSLEVLARYLDQAAAENYLPYAPTMSQYVTDDEIAERWANLDEWYSNQGHFWVGTGPYYLDEVSFDEDMIILRRYANYPDLSTKWDKYVVYESIFLPLIVR